MTKMWECFINDFHSIKGVSIGERQHNFQKLLRSNSIPDDEQQLLVDNLNPISYMEKLWHIDVLIYYKKTAQLLEIVKSGNLAFVSKIVKQNWFFHEAFDDVSPEEFVSDYLPFMSYSVKAKLLKKLASTSYEEKLDELFDRILQRYGLNFATRIIPGCSVPKIMSILKVYVLTLSTNQLKMLYAKDPNLIKVYFEEYKQHQKENTFTSCFLKYLAQKNLDLFWEIVGTDYFINKVKLGRRTTKKAVNIKKTDIITKPEKYIIYLRQETLVRDLNKQGNFRMFFGNIFPKTINDLEKEENVYNRLLKYYPKHSRYYVYEETFNNVLKNDIWSKSYYVRDSLLPLIGNVNIREQWAELKYKESNNSTFIQYYKMENCMALVKKKINLTSKSKVREQLFQILIKACALNKDYEAFEEVLKYYCARHRNEDKNARYSFINNIDRHVTLEELRYTHWKYIQELVTLQEVDDKFCGVYSLLRVKQIEYLLKNNYPEEEITRLIVDFIKDEVRGYYPFFKTVEKVKNPEVEKKILLQILEHLPKYIEADKTDPLYDLVEVIMGYNSRNGRNKIDLYTNKSVVDILKQSFENISYWRSSKMFLPLVCSLKRSKLEEEVLDAYWEKVVPKLCSNGVLKWYLKHDPLIIVENFNKIMDNVVKMFMSKKWLACVNPTAHHLFLQIWNMMKLYSHLNLDVLLKKYVLNSLKSDETKRMHAQELCTALAVLSTAKEYINVVQDFNLVPTSAERNIENGNEVFKQQKIFLAAFKYVVEPLEYLSFLVDKFCQGDYLQIALLALYSAFCKSPEKGLKVYINKLSENKALSVRKHALSLSYCISDEATLLELLKYFEAESYSSLTKCMFLGVLKYFSHNPSQSIFIKVVSYAQLLQNDDMESLEALTTTRIPKNFKSSYIENIWLVLERFKLDCKVENVAKMYSLLSAILDLIDKACIQDLPKSFCKEIIQNYAFNNAANRVHSILPFLVRFLMYSDAQVENLEFVFMLLTKYKCAIWNGNCRKNEREIVFGFFNEFYAKACGKEVKVDFIQEFYNHWKHAFTPVDTFEEYLQINLLLYKKQADKDLEMYARDIVLYSEKVNAQFGQTVFPRFITVLSNSLGEKHYQILSNMLKFKTTSLNCVLVMRLIMQRGDLFYGDEIIKPYWDIHATLQTQLNDPEVQLYYNLYFKQ